MRQQFTRQGSGLGFGPPKSRKSVRTIDVDEETIALLREEHERQRFDRRAWGTAYRLTWTLSSAGPVARLRIRTKSGGTSLAGSAI
jgi:hypothetical protein